MLVGFLADYLARLRQFADKPVSQFLLHIGLVLLLLSLQNGLLQLCLCGQCDTFLIGSIEHTDLILVSDEFAGSTVYLVQCHLAVQFLSHLQIKLLRSQGFSRQEVVDTPADEVRVAAVVAFLIVAFGSRHGQFLGTGELTLCEAVLTHTLSLGNSSSQTTEDVVLLAADGH